MNITIFNIQPQCQRCFHEAPHMIKVEEHVHQQRAPYSLETQQSAKKPSSTGPGSEQSDGLQEGGTGHEISDPGIRGLMMLWTD